MKERNKLIALAGKPLLRKLLLIVKLSMIFLTVCCLQVSANNAFLKTVIALAEKNTIYSYMPLYKDKAIPFSKVATQITVSGTVKNEKGEFLPGASITVKNTKVAAITDAEGKFSLVIPDAEGTLVFSYIGYENFVIHVTASQKLTIVLKEKVKLGEEVVVIGYGSLKKKNTPGAIASVKGKDLDINTSTNFAQSLQGKASGVQIVQSTGQPGAGVSV